MFPALTGGFFTTEPPEKPCKMYSRREVQTEDIKCLVPALGGLVSVWRRRKAYVELGMRVRSTRAGGPQIEEAPSPRQRSYRLMEDMLHTRPCPQKVGTRAGLGVRSHLPQPPPNGRLSQSSTLNPEQAILPLLKLPHLGLPWLSSG